MEEGTIVTFKRTFFGFEQVNKIGPGQWSAVNIPALKPEPFVNNYSNYLTKFQFQLETIMNIYRRSGEKVLLSLAQRGPKVVEALHDDSRYWRR